MKIKLSLALAIFIHFPAISQIPKTLGEGYVKIGMYSFNAQDTINLSADPAHLFIYFNYHIKKDKILRNMDNDLGSTQTATDNSNLNGASVKSTISAQVFVPTYIIDWDKKESYVFYKKKGEVYGTKNRLQDNRYELFFKELAGKQNIPAKVDTNNQNLIHIAGLPCYLGRYQGSSGWRSFAYTKYHLDFYSPLNAFIPYFPYAVMSIDAEHTDDPKAKTRVTGISRFQVITFNQDKQDQSLFLVPKIRHLLTDSAFRNIYIKDQ
jgi:hypothetical protein